MAREPDIHCPQCGYRPSPLDRWYCTVDCGTRWHTFWTGGVCPGCGYAWQETQCPACARTSPHRSWYHFPREDDDELERSEPLEKADAIRG
ncbi:MAG: hypothetical protein DIU56_002000 [Pseudomonadota bacterium]|jgi:hypothetical protein|nr:MAG: hypothetical protein DIU56_06685 [Pseudomonadota bacterium]